MPQAKTPDEMRVHCATLLQTIDETQIADAQVIDGYPISYKARGRCELTVEFQPKRGWRRVRRTTNVMGKWCKPHHSVFCPCPTFPALHKGALISHGYGWLEIGRYEIKLVRANEVAIPFGQSDRHAEPRYDEVRFKTRTTSPDMTVTEEICTLPASTAEEIECWDVWCSARCKVLSVIGARADLAGLPSPFLDEEKETPV